MEVPKSIIAQAAAAARIDGTGLDTLSSKPSIDAQASSTASYNGGKRKPQASSAPQDILNAGEETPIERVPPLVYGPRLGQVDFSQDGLDTKAKVADDGRLNINIDQKSYGLSDLLVPALRSQLNLQQVEQSAGHPLGFPPSTPSGARAETTPPPLNVVMHVVGSRGDVQPFVALGKVLKETYGHRVRLATHRTFRDFVEENGLEFFSIGGDPAELMAFMVKNPGLMPGMDSLRSGDVGKRRKGMYEIVQGCWRSCIEIGDGTGPKASDDHLDSRSSLDSGIGMDGDPSAKPFVADAIIANPPSFAHIHCAERLAIPLHLMFTMPWSPTQAFPHPLANIQSSNADSSLTNFVSYALVEMMTWQGLGDIINRFREKSLNLEPVSLMWAPGMASRMKIPYTYCWSPALIPKPKDWGPHISISGFYFLSLASTFTPDPDLVAFLKAGPPPVYIGFGSIVVDDPNAMTKLIFEAVRKSGQRALVSKGWGGFGADVLGIPEGVFMLGNVPHDWLFKHVSCVVHHGGAGTTAAGIALSRPTVVVPFFGDQPFWGAMVARAGAGPLPIPSKQLTAEKLAAAIIEALEPTTLQRAQELGARIDAEKGTDAGAQSFHARLDLDSLRCLVSPGRAAVWRVKRTTIRLSAFAAQTLSNEGLLNFNDIKLYRPREYDSEDGPWDPISGGASALLGTVGSLMMGFADFPVEMLRALRIKPAEKDTVSSPVGEHLPSADLLKMSVEATQHRIENTKTLAGSGSPSELEISNEGAMAQTLSNKDENSLAQNEQDTKTSHPNSMRNVLRGSFTKSPSRSSSPSRHTLEHHRSHSGTLAGQISLDAAVGAGKSIKQIVGAGLKSPMDFTLALARGFHNAPKLYGDESVRQADKVTGLQSGLKAAGKEFSLGLYDGISGLVTQPLDGAKREGVTGLIKGFGKGIGGVVLKPGAAIWGLPGYTFKGIYKELQKHLGSSVQNYIVAARTTQGYDEWLRASREEQLAVISNWQAIQVEIEKEKSLMRHGSFHGHHCYLKATIEEKKRQAAEKKIRKKGVLSSEIPQAQMRPRGIHPFVTANSKSSTKESTYEEAIQASVAATSRGNPIEDQVIESAIRASLQELHSASKEGNNSDAVQRAIKASVTESARAQARNSGKGCAEFHDDELEAALKRSVLERPELSQDDDVPTLDFDDSGVDTDEDENMRAAIEKSKSIITKDTANTHEMDEDLEFKKSVDHSGSSHDEHEDDSYRSKTEEEIVLQYVKRQSLLEEEHRKSMSEPDDSTAPP